MNNSIKKYLSYIFLRENESIFVVFIFFILLLIFFIKLENPILAHHDEITHACMGKMIIKLNDWVTMHEGKDISFLKPPLYFWLEAIFLKIFGFTDYVSRLPSAIMGFLTVYFNYLLVLILFNNKKLTILNLIIISTSYYLLKYAKLSMLDMPITFTTTLALYAFVKYEFYKEKKYVYLFSFACAMGYYIKAVQGIYPLIILPIYYIFTKQIKNLFKLEIILSYFLFLCLIGVWFIPQLIKYGDAFLYSQSGIGPIVNRGLDGYYNKFYTPFIKLIGLNFPWGIINFISLIFCFINFKRYDLEYKNKIIFLMVSFFVIIGMLSISKTFFLRYLLPAMIPFSIIGSVKLNEWISEQKYIILKKIVFFTLLLVFLKISILPVKFIDKDSTPYYGLFLTLNYLDINKSEIVVYKEKYYKLNQGLSYYSDIFPKRYIPNIEELLSSKNTDEFYVTNYKSFVELKEKKLNIKIVSTDNKNWILFKFY